MAPGAPEMACACAGSPTSPFTSASLSDGSPAAAPAAVARTGAKPRGSRRLPARCLCRWPYGVVGSLSRVHHRCRFKCLSKVGSGDNAAAPRLPVTALPDSVAHSQLKLAAHAHLRGVHAARRRCVACTRAWHACGRRAVGGVEAQGAARTPIA